MMLTMGYKFEAKCAFSLLNWGQRVANTGVGEKEAGHDTKKETAIKRRFLEMKEG
jgi:hypothetical protein